MDSSAPVCADKFNFAGHLLELNARRGENLAYIDDHEELTYEQLDSQVRRFADGLRGQGVQEKERVLIALNDCNAWPVAFLGCILAGIVPVPANTLLTLDDYKYLLTHSGASAAIVSGTLIEIFKHAISDLPGNHFRLLVAVGAGAESPDVLNFVKLLSDGRESQNVAETTPDSVAFWLYSSGSTGRPKGVLHTHANLYWTSELYAKSTLGILESDRVFSAAKLFFAYGLGNALTFPLSVGASTVLMAERPTPTAVYARIRNHKPSIFCGAPSLYAGLLAHPEIPSRQEVALRVCTSAGEALPRELGERFAAQFGIDILDGLGSTEMLHIFVSNRTGDIRYGSTGKAVAGYEVEIRDDSGNLAAPGEIGDLWVKGPSSASQYWNDPIKTRETFHGAWLRTGDKYIRGVDGYFVYAGRNDDMLKISGQYVSPFEVESTLVQHDLVLESAVVGVLDPVGLCKCKAYVVLRNGVAPSDALAKELQLFVKEKLAPFKRPHFIEFVTDLPKTATGKIQRFKLRERSAHA